MYRIISVDNTVFSSQPVNLDSHFVFSGSHEEVSRKFRELQERGRKRGLTIKSGIDSLGRCWFSAMLPSRVIRMFIIEKA